MEESMSDLVLISPSPSVLNDLVRCKIRPPLSISIRPFLVR